MYSCQITVGAMNLPGDGPLGVRLLLWVVAPCMVVLATLLGASAYLTHDRMIGERVGKLQALVDVTTGVAAQLEAEVVAGRLSRANAIERFRTLCTACATTMATTCSPTTSTAMSF